MIDKIIVSAKDENVYNFNDFEFVENEEGYYILCEEGYFDIAGLEDFYPDSDKGAYYIVNEDEDKFEISNEDFEKIKNIIFKN